MLARSRFAALAAAAGVGGFAAIGIVVASSVSASPVPSGSAPGAVHAPLVAAASSSKAPSALPTCPSGGVLPSQGGGVSVCVVPTPSKSPSKSPSRSASPSKSASKSPSKTPSKSPTPSRTPSKSPSPSRTPSKTPTHSASPSHTPSASHTPSRSASRSASASPSNVIVIPSGDLHTEQPSLAPIQSGVKPTVAPVPSLVLPTFSAPSGSGASTTPVVTLAQPVPARHRGLPITVGAVLIAGVGSAVARAVRGLRRS